LSQAPHMACERPGDVLPVPRRQEGPQPRRGLLRLPRFYINIKSPPNIQAILCLEKPGPLPGFFIVKRVPVIASRSLGEAILIHRKSDKSSLSQSHRDHRERQGPKGKPFLNALLFSQCSLRSLASKASGRENRCFGAETLKAISRKARKEERLSSRGRRLGRRDPDWTQNRQRLTHAKHAKGVKKNDCHLEPIPR